jgi:hypothetical protein
LFEPAAAVPWRVGALRQAHGPPTSWCVRQEIASPLEDDEPLLVDEELWLDEDEDDDAGVVCMAGGVVVDAVAAAVGGVVDAPVAGGAAKAAALSVTSAAPAATIKRTDIRTSLSQARPARPRPRCSDRLTSRPDGGKLTNLRVSPV